MQNGGKTVPKKIPLFFKQIYRRISHLFILFFFKQFYLFMIWLHWVLVVAHGI